MAFNNFYTFQPLGDTLVDIATQGSAWDLTKTNVINWALADGYSGEFWTAPSDILPEIAGALSAIEFYINVDFVFVDHFNNPNTAWQSGSDITFSLDSSGLITGNSWAVGHFPNTPNKILAGDIFLNVNSPANSLPSYEPGSQGFFLILHETFHALGLKHTHDDGGSGRPTLGELGLSRFDQDWFSIMSYNDQIISNVAYDPATPMMLDVFGLQYLYGPNLTSNSGNTTHEILDANLYYTIWDPSGNDWIDASKLKEGWYIELPDAYLSDLSPVLTGLALPSASYVNGFPTAPAELVWLMGDIENVIGSAYADEIRGNKLDNLLTGGSGDDIIYGGGGNDTAQFGAQTAAIRVTINENGTISVTDRNGNEGTDTLTSVENLAFTDRTLDMNTFSSLTQLSNEQFAALAEMYVAYFNRAPDAEGLFFWADQFAEGRTREQIAERFFDQDEVRTIYTDPSNTDAFVTAVYANVLGRKPDTEGFAFWKERLAEGDVTQDTFVLKIIESTKNNVGPNDIIYLSDKVDLGLYYSAIKGLSDVADGRQVMAAFGDQATSNKLGAKTAIDGHYADATSAVDGGFLFEVVGIVDDPFVGFT